MPNPEKFIPGKSPECKSCPFLNRSSGRIEVIIGDMFSGKTDEFIRRLSHAQIGGKKIQAFKPNIDNRYGKGINSHRKDIYWKDAVDIEISEPERILELLKDDTEIVGIDEGQFFNNKIIQVCEEMRKRNIRVIINGLDLNFRGEPFGAMPYLIGRADEVLKLHAVCMVCGEPAAMTQRVKVMADGTRVPANYDDPLILVGASNDYEARCLLHHEVPGKPKD